MTYSGSLRIIADDILDIFKRLENIIKGAESPCRYCTGCQMENEHKGICEGFKFKDKFK
jgi:hypothetical protein